LPGGPVGPASRWAATLNVEGQTIYSSNRGRIEGGEREGRKEWNRGGAMGPQLKRGTNMLKYQYFDI